ncbi:MAG: DUF983 domain-containing protein [Geminicoccaceae bacterium]|nr:DUF983 domain-containing protein [Geminicoccaceae bacterium]MDW8368892.1 DUF983 domain-containing protein [Geminicoccaceae bacterium]
MKAGASEGEVSPLAASLGARCPRCGRGRLFAGFLSVVERCDVCGLDLRAQDSGDGPVAFIILIVGFVVVGAALFVEVRWGWPVWLHLLVWLPLAAALCLGLMRPLKAALIALQYRHRRDTLGG